MRFAAAVFLILVAFVACGDDPTAALRDIDSTSNRVEGHEHRATIPSGLIDLPPENDVQLETSSASYAAGQVPAHTHTITINATHLTVLQQPGGLVEIISSPSDAHAMQREHVFVFIR